MNINLLSQQVETMYGRLSTLYNHANATLVPAAELLPVALKELGVASEELQVAMEELTRQNDELLAAHNRTGAERQRYQNLFEFASDAYLVTDPGGNIQEANRAAVALFLRQQRFLVGKPLTSVVAIDDRSLFRAKLSQLAQRDHVDAMLTADVIRHPEDTPVLRWLVRDITERKRAQASLEQADYTPFQDRSLQTYTKGKRFRSTIKPYGSSLTAW
ncbi:MAG: PAS domain S-box protein [Phormidesmis sp. CAN_BIN44]|nr:PAS domain S-box protein [Phormidesmis sp. CAN_BIN44]